MRKEDLVRNLNYVANILEAVHQDETRLLSFPLSLSVSHESRCRDR